MQDDKDRAAEVLGLANIVISYRLTWPDDVNLMARLLFPKNIRYAKLVQEVFQHQGEYEWLKVREISRSFGAQESWSHADGRGEGQTESLQESEQQADQQTWSKAKSRQIGHGTSEQSGWSHADGSSSGRSESPLVDGLDVKRMLKLGSQQASWSNGRSGGTATNENVTEGDTSTEGGGSTKTTGQARTAGKSNQSSQTDTHGGSTSRSISISEKLMPLPRLVRVRQDTGQLIDSVNDQYEQFASELSSVDRQEAFARVRGGKAVKFRTIDVIDPFVSATAQMKAVAWFKRKLFEAHNYYFVPSEDDLAVEQRPTRDLLEEDEHREESPAEEENLLT